MPANKLTTFSVALTTLLSTNILNPNITSLAGPIGIVLTQPYLILRRIRIINKTGNSATFSLWRGATGANAAGTEVIGQGMPVPGNQAFDWGGLMRLDAADFLVGGSGTATALVLECELEVGFG